MYINYRNSAVKILIIILLYASAVYSQTVPLKFDRVSKENGLSTSAPTAVIQDSRGFIWITSQNGLNRFDGTGIKFYAHDKKISGTISDDFTMCLCEDSDGNIWVGTISNGLNKLDRRTDKFEVFLNDPKDENSLSSNNIRALVFDDGKLWIGTQHGGLCVMDIRTKKFLRYKNNPGNPLSLSNDFIWTLLKDRDGNIWIGTNGSGLDKFDKRNNTFTHYRHDPKDNTSISHNEIRSIYEDNEGNIWVGTNGSGLNLLDKKTGKFNRIVYSPLRKIDTQNNVVLGIVQDETGNIWIGEYFNGLSIYSPKTGEYKNYFLGTPGKEGLPFNGVYSMYKDNKGIIWICHEGKGIFVYNSKKYKFSHYYHIPNDPNSLCEDILWTFSEDKKGHIWIASKNGISVFNPEANSFRNFFHDPENDNTLSDNSIGYIFKDRGDYMWVGTSAGALDRHDLKTGKWEHFYNHPDDTSKRLANITCMVEDNEGQLWMATYSDGLKMFNRERTVVTTFIHDDNNPNSISSNGIWNLHLINDTEIWVGTYATGVDKFDLKAKTFTNYRNNPQDTNSLSGNTVTYTYKDKEGIYWITTYGSGLNRYDAKQNSFKWYTTKNGLPDNTLYGILEDKSGRFWISTNQGITRFDPKTEIIVNYNTGDGLQSQEFNQNSFLKSSTGDFYFGGINGFNVFNPEEFSESNNPVPVYITSVKVFNNNAELPVAVTEAKEIEFSYNENFFTFEYSALEYYNPAKIEYAYMLDGLDNNWNYVKNIRTAPYTNVSPGEYFFKIKCTNADGVWNSNEKIIKVSIIPPWWQKWWFRGGVGLLIIGIVLFGVNKKYSNLKKWKAAQNEFTRQLIDSHEEERKKISAELHDSLGQDLVIIKNSANMALNNHLSGKDVSNYISQISDISSSALNNVRAISHNLRPVELDRLGLTDTIKSVMEKVAESSEIYFTSDIDNIDGLLDKNNEVNFCRVIQESTSNILKHSKASEASVHIKCAGNEIIAVIKDNGTGFDHENIINHSSYKTFGLTGMNERVKMMKGTLNIKSAQNEGTEIIFSIPVNKHT